jgi:hypothetical protein
MNSDFEEKHPVWSTPRPIDSGNLRRSGLVSVHRVRQAKPGFAIVLKREQHVK